MKHTFTDVKVSHTLSKKIKNRSIIYNIVISHQSLLRQECQFLTVRPVLLALKVVLALGKSGLGLDLGLALMAMALNTLAWA